MRHFTLMMAQRNIQPYAAGKLRAMMLFTYSVETLAMCYMLLTQKIIGKL